MKSGAKRYDDEDTLRGGMPTQAALLNRAQRTGGVLTTILLLKDGSAWHVTHVLADFAGIAGHCHRTQELLENHAKRQGGCGE